MSLHLSVDFDLILFCDISVCNSETATRMITDYIHNWVVSPFDTLFGYVWGVVWRYLKRCLEMEIGKFSSFMFYGVCLCFIADYFRTWIDVDSLFHDCHPCAVEHNMFIECFISSNFVSFATFCESWVLSSMISGWEITWYIFRVGFSFVFIIFSSDQSGTYIRKKKDSTRSSFWWNLFRSEPKVVVPIKTYDYWIIHMAKEAIDINIWKFIAK